MIKSPLKVGLEQPLLVIFRTSIRLWLWLESNPALVSRWGLGPSLLGPRSWRMRLFSLVQAPMLIWTGTGVLSLFLDVVGPFAWAHLLLLKESFSGRVLVCGAGLASLGLLVMTAQAARPHWFLSQGFLRLRRSQRLCRILAARAFVSSLLP